MEAVVASAPGKVLLTGGYLILERPNAGLVLSTNARFFAIVKPLYQPLKPDSWASGCTDVKLTSPQLARESVYKLSLKNLSLEYVSSGDSRNPFVEQAVQYCVAAARATVDKKNKDSLEKLLLHGLDITILGSNDFYSYRNQIEARGLPLTPDALATLPPFASITFNDEGSNVENCKPEVAKTGLGSSAAMTTAVVAALLHYLGVVNLPSMLKDHQHEKHIADLDLVHVIAQTAHCIAQGKVGSGFDVSSAVYGSQRYVRFSPEVISSAQVAVTGTPLQEVVPQILKGKWDHDRTKFSLPPLMTLLLGEPGTGGSSTPSMVGSVKKWQKSDPQKSLETWKKLSEANSALEMQLNTLSKLAEEHWEEYESLINSCSILKSEKWTQQVSKPSQEIIVKALLGARDAMLGIRYHMHQMGEAAGVPNTYYGIILPVALRCTAKTPLKYIGTDVANMLKTLNQKLESEQEQPDIEPESQTKLLDATMDMEGVLLAGVPGAGGFDAVFAVTLGDAGSHVSNSWSSFNVLALLVREDPQGVSLESADPRTKEITSSISSVNVG